jgi:ABC-2 type transport system permease protein
MIGTLASITIRGLVNRRRTTLLLLAGALLVLISFLSGLGEPSRDEALATTGGLLAQVGIGVVLPLVAVVIGTAAVGSELEDGTIVYLLAKPIPRPLLTGVKLAAAWLTVVAIVAPAMALAALAGSGDGALAVAAVVATVVGGLEYTAIFLALSLVTGRALVLGLAYVVIWEGVVAGLFAGTRILSVRQHTLAIADAVRGDGVIPADLEPIPALVAAAVVTAVAAVLAARLLARVELRGDTD